ncbi:DUF302 domain-containing protein [bacterium]|nr:DUF302 domain-containing protein [bacterium]MBU1991152.1 DUF302 domain-containing protein [bacterium]
MKVHKKILGSIALSSLLLIGFSGCGSDDTAAAPAAAESTISPYQRIAVLSGTWAEVPAVADTIASYVVTTDESNVSGLGYPTNWVVAGANPASGETYETTDLLPIPGMGSAITGTSRVIELCNGAYATQATNTGRFHGSALPCEVSVHSDGTNIYVDMLDADAIFSVFFSDLNDTQKTGLKSVASQVKSEIRGMVVAALDDNNETYTESTLAMGPKWDTADIERLSYKSPYTVYSYKLQSGAAFVKGTDDKALAAKIIEILGDDTSTAENRVPGLSNASAWRSGRPEPLAIPGVFVAEACSPKYAKMATKLGNEYITALPCEITVYVDENDPTGETLSISFLNPNFMFGTMFEGAVEKALADEVLTKADAVLYSTLADKVFADLRMIVDEAVQTSSLGTLVTTPVIVAP